MTGINGANPVEAAMEANRQQQLAAAQIVSELRATARGIYEQLTARYLSSLGVGEIPDPKVLRSYAREANDCAPYLLELYGNAKPKHAPGAIQAR